MAFWTKYKQQKSISAHDPLDQLKQPTKSEYAWQDELLDVKKDIEDINLVLNEHKRRADAIEVVLSSIIERNTDAIELKESLQEFLEKIGYVKAPR